MEIHSSLPEDWPLTLQKTYENNYFGVHSLVHAWRTARGETVNVVYRVCEQWSLKEVIIDLGNRDLIFKVGSENKFHARGLEPRELLDTLFGYTPTIPSQRAQLLEWLGIRPEIAKLMANLI